MWQKFGQYRPGPDEGFRAWALRIAHSRCSATSRAPSGIKRCSTINSIRLSAKATFTTVGSINSRLELLADCYRKLPDEDRQLIRDRYKTGEGMRSDGGNWGGRRTRCTGPCGGFTNGCSIASGAGAGNGSLFPPERNGNHNSNQQADSNEFFDLLTDLAEDRLSLEKAAEVQQLLLADSAQPQEYVNFMLMLSGLYWIGRDQPSGECGTGIDQRAADTFPAGGALGPDPTLPVSAPFDSPAPLVPPITGGDQAAFPWFGGLVVWSYVCAALFLGVGVLAARLWGPAGDPAPTLSGTPSWRRPGPPRTPPR